MNVLLFVGLTVFAISSVACFRFLLGPGRWLVLNTLQCEDPEQYPMHLLVTQKKLNRTHDVFRLIIETVPNYTHLMEYGIQIDAYKEVDGGFKFFQSFADPCACKFVQRHARDNMIRALILGGLEPPDCPLEVERVVIENFLMDYRELPRDGVYGTFDARVFTVLNKKKVGCMRILLNFDDRNDDDYDD